MIELLSSETIQKIAAGEVIERPGSIVKELVENSIDAKADSITVEIKDGGKSFIQIIDNGSGIHKDDLLMAFKRHATSKLKEFDDLYQIYSLGFRGEALASVAAAADVSIKTKTENETAGAFLNIHNGIFSDITPIAMNRGTVLTITNLFERIPVRKKFLRKDSTEANIITNMMYRFALSNTNISFKYIKDNRVVFETVQGSLKENLRELFDSSLVDNMVEINIKNKNYRFFGLTSNNNYYRGNRGLQYLFINGRYVENKDIQRAVEDNYTSVIPNGKYPVFQLFLEISPSLIDVNIHPNKQKVKINIIDDILRDIKEEFAKQLKSGIEIPGIDIRKKAPEVKRLDHIAADQEKEIIEKVYGKKDSLTKDSYNLFKPNHQINDEKIERILPLEENQELLIEDTKIISKPLVKKFHVEEKEIPYSSSQINFHQDETEDKCLEEPAFPKLENCTIITVLYDTYILFKETGEENLYLLDQHAAHERILFEKFTENYKNNSISSQQLISPVILTMKEDEIRAFEENRSIFERLGYELDLFDDSHLILRAFPVVLGNIEGEKLLIEIFDSFGGSDKDIDSLRNKIIMKSCKAAVKAGDHLSALEIESLLKQLSAAEYPFTCPHGRPTLIQITKTDIEKIFSRIK